MGSVITGSLRPYSVSFGRMMSAAIMSGLPSPALSKADPRARAHKSHPDRRTRLPEAVFDDGASRFLCLSGRCRQETGYTAVVAPNTMTKRSLPCFQKMDQPDGFGTFRPRGGALEREGFNRMRCTRLCSSLLPDDRFARTLWPAAQLRHRLNVGTIPARARRMSNRGRLHAGRCRGAMLEIRARAEISAADRWARLVTTIATTPHGLTEPCNFAHPPTTRASSRSARSASSATTSSADSSTSTATPPDENHDS